MSSNKVNLGDWHSKIGTSAENSQHREAPNKHNMGAKKYKEMIAKDTARVDAHGNMPFTFSKPTKTTRHREDIYWMCDKCSHIAFVSKYRAGQVCGGCKSYGSVNADNTFKTEEALELRIQELSKPNE